MNYFWIVYFLLVIIVIPACTQKLPLPEKEDTGVLVIPLIIEDGTKHELAYYHELKYVPETESKILINPQGKEQFSIIKNFPIGKFVIYGVRYVPKGIGYPLSTSKEGDIYNPIIFEIYPHKISILNRTFLIEQFWSNPPINTVMSQTFRFQKMSESEANKAKSELETFPNAQFWEIDFSDQVNDTNDILEVIKLAASQGSADAQYKLGQLYLTGRMLSKDYDEAINWIKRAAENENTEAQYVLGNIYQEGRKGITKDTNEAIKWYMKSANNGYVKSQLILGNIYENHATLKDYKEAAKWYKKASQKGNEEARASLDIICQDYPSICS